MRQILIRAANVVFFVGCCFLVADVANDLAADRLTATPVASAPSPPPAPPRAPGWDERAAILDRNLFGAQLAGDQPVVEEVVEEELEETKLPLTLLGTLAASDVEISRAAILDTQHRSSEVLQTGDVLEHHPGVTIHRIERARILLLNQGRREELILAEAGPRVLPALPARRPRASRRRPPRGRNTAVERARAKAAQAAAENDVERGALQERLSELSELVSGGELTPEELQEEMEELQELEEE